jgi:hypothetical protein
MMRVDILIAGAAIATVGPAWVIAGDACSYLLFALTLTSVRLQPAALAQRSADAAPTRNGFGQLLRMVAHNPWLRNTTVMFAAFNVGDGALLVFLPGCAVRLGLGTAGYGWLAAGTTGGADRSTVAGPPQVALAAAGLDRVRASDRRCAGHGICSFRQQASRSACLSASGCARLR